MPYARLSALLSISCHTTFCVGAGIWGRWMEGSLHLRDGRPTAAGAAAELNRLARMGTRCPPFPKPAPQLPQHTHQCGEAGVVPIALVVLQEVAHHAGGDHVACGEGWCGEVWARHTGGQAKFGPAKPRPSPHKGCGESHTPEGPHCFRNKEPFEATLYQALDLRPPSGTGCSPTDCTSPVMLWNATPTHLPCGMQGKVRWAAKRSRHQCTAPASSGRRQR